MLGPQQGLLRLDLGLLGLKQGLLDIDLGQAFTKISVNFSLQPLSHRHNAHQHLNFPRQMAILLPQRTLERSRKANNARDRSSWMA
jgi:hypothetical protein